MGHPAVDLGHAFDALDLDRRLAETPADALIRGLFFHVAPTVLAALDPAAALAFRSLAGSSFRWPFGMYAMHDFLRVQALAAALVSPDDPIDGLRRIWHATPSHAPLISAEKYGRFLTGGDPLRAFRWLTNNRQLFCNYGEWWLEEDRAGHAVMEFRKEYLWIDGAHRGGAEGSLGICGVIGTVTPVLDTPYDGRLVIDW